MPIDDWTSLTSGVPKPPCWASKTVNRTFPVGLAVVHSISTVVAFGEPMLAVTGTETVVSASEASNLTQKAIEIAAASDGPAVAQCTQSSTPSKVTAVSESFGTRLCAPVVGVPWYVPCWVPTESAAVVGATAPPGSPSRHQCVGRW